MLVLKIVERLQCILNSLKTEIIDNSNISSEHLNDSGLHLNKHGRAKLAINLIEKVRKLHRKNVNVNWQQSGQSLARPQYYVFNCVCKNDCKRKSDTVGPEHPLEIESAIRSADFQDTGNQMNALLGKKWTPSMK